jgi:hypothetical protein
VSVESSNTVTAKVLLVETCRRYVAAPAEAFQVNVGLVATLTAASRGATKTGAAGGAIVVKLHTLEYALVPPEIFEFTRQ